MGLNSEKLAQEIATLLQEKLAMDVEVIKVGEVSIIADYFVIASGRTDQHVRSLYEYVDEDVKAKFDVDPIHRDGAEGGKWIVMDYGVVIVHLFRQEEREFYSIEKLWTQAPKVEFEK